MTLLWLVGNLFYILWSNRRFSLKLPLSYWLDKIYEISVLPFDCKQREGIKSVVGLASHWMLWLAITEGGCNVPYIEGFSSVCLKMWTRLGISSVKTCQQFPSTQNNSEIKQNYQILPLHSSGKWSKAKKKQIKILKVPKIQIRTVWSGFTWRLLPGAHPFSPFPSSVKVEVLWRQGWL